MEDNYGHLEIRLDELLKKKGLSKNKLSYKAEISWKQIDNYCTNNITPGVQQLNKRKLATGRIKPVFFCQIFFMLVLYMLYYCGIIGSEVMLL